MGGWSRGLRAPPSEISIVALMLAAGISAANAQHALDPITVLATKTGREGHRGARDGEFGASGATRSDPAETRSEIFYGLPSVWFRERADTAKARRASRPQSCFLRPAPPSRVG